MIFVEVVNIPATDLGVLGSVEYDGYTGLNLVLGCSDGGVEILLFSSMALLPYAMVLLGVILTAVNTFGKKSKKMLNDIAGGLFLIAGVTFFMMPNFMVFADNVVAKVVAELEFKAVIGAIVSGVCAVISGVAMLSKSLINK